MKSLILLVCMLITFVSCRENNEKSEYPIEEVKQDILIDTTIQYGIESTKRSTVDSLSKLKIEKEYQKLREETKRHISELKEDTDLKPFTFDSISVDYISKINCTANFKIEKLNQKFCEKYENSNFLTNEIDGKLFCLSSKTLKDGTNSRIIYKRTEGGHIDDEITLETIKADKRINSLKLYYHFGREGYDVQIESQLSPNKIYRKIVEVYGWGMPNSPTITTLQDIAISSIGELTLLKENIKKVNFEEYE